MHDRAAITIGRYRKWFCVEENTGLIEKLHSQIGQAMRLGPVVGKGFQEHSNIIVRIWTGITPRTGTELYDALDALSVNLVERIAEADQDLINACHNVHHT